MNKAAIQLSALAFGVLVSPLFAGPPRTHPLGVTGGRFSSLPAGPRRVCLATMTCRDFLALDQSARLGVAYWVDGLAAAPDDSQVDLERALDILMRDCRRAPDSFLREEAARSF